MRNKVIVVSIFIVSFVALGTASFSGGSGTSDDPYQISNCQELQNIHYEDLGAYYELIDTVDCEGFNDEDEDRLEGFTPIGYEEDLSSSSFSGSLDGQGELIENVDIEAQDGDYFIGIIADADHAEVKNIEIKDSEAWGTTYTGLLLGRSSDSEIKNIEVHGSETTYNQEWASIISAGVFDSSEVQNINVYNSNIYFEGDESDEQHQAGLVAGRVNTDEAYFSDIQAYNIDTVEGYEGSYAFIFGEDSDVSGIREAEFENTYWDEETVTVDEEAEEDEEYATRLTTEEMTGDEAEINMEFDFEEDWGVEDSYPIICAISPDTLECTEDPEIKSFDFSIELDNLEDGDDLVMSSEIVDPDGHGIEDVDFVFTEYNINPECSLEDGLTQIGYERKNPSTEIDQEGVVVSETLLEQYQEAYSTIKDQPEYEELGTATDWYVREDGTVDGVNMQEEVSRTFDAEEFSELEHYESLYNDVLDNSLDRDCSLQEVMVQHAEEKEVPSPTEEEGFLVEEKLLDWYDSEAYNVIYTHSNYQDLGTAADWYVRPDGVIEGVNEDQEVSRVWDSEEIDGIDSYGDLYEELDEAKMRFVSNGEETEEDDVWESTEISIEEGTYYFFGVDAEDEIGNTNEDEDFADVEHSVQLDVLNEHGVEDVSPFIADANAEWVESAEDIELLIREDGEVEFDIYNSIEADEAGSKEIVHSFEEERLPDIFDYRLRINAEDQDQQEYVKETEVRGVNITGSERVGVPQLEVLKLVDESYSNTQASGAVNITEDNTVESTLQLEIENADSNNAFDLDLNPSIAEECDSDSEGYSIDENSVETFEIGVECLTGERSDAVLETVEDEPQEGYNTVYADFETEIYTNVTREEDIKFVFDKRGLPEWSSIESGSLEGDVEGNSDDIEFDQTIDDLIMYVGEEHSTSSLSEGEYDASFSYYYEDSDSDGGGGFFFDDDEEDDGGFDVTFGNNDYELTYGSSGGREFTISNYVNRENSVSIEALEDDFVGCSFLEVEENVVREDGMLYRSSDYDDTSGYYELPPSGEDITGSRITESFLLRYDIPSEEKLEEEFLEYEEFTCVFDTESEYGTTETFEVTMELRRGLIQRVFDYFDMETDFSMPEVFSTNQAFEVCTDWEKSLADEDCPNENTLRTGIPTNIGLYVILLVSLLVLVPIGRWYKRRFWDV